LAYNARLIEEVELEENDSTGYYVECCKFFRAFGLERPNIIGTDVQVTLDALLDMLLSPPEHRELGSVKSLDRLVRPFLANECPSVESGASEAAALLLLGMAGKALYFLSKQTHSSQFEMELARLFRDVEDLRSNLWLFHLSARTAQAGFQISFIPEGKEPTPDFAATRGGLTVYVEANTRNPAAKAIDGIRDALWNVMHGSAKSGGKQIKFKDRAYDPGLIVVDISNCDADSNETGESPHVKLLSDALKRTRSGWIYDLSLDPQFFEHRENTGNIVEYAIRYFHQMADYNRYCVRALLIGVSMAVRTTGPGVLGAPKGAMMIVDSLYPQLALPELASQIYLVDTRAPLSARFEY
jgi:hypothetical protein